VNIDWRKDILVLWSLITALGYILTPRLSVLNLGLVPYNFRVLILWTVLMIPPIYLSYREFKGPFGKTINYYWALIVIAGLLLNFLSEILFTNPQLLSLNYYQLWFLLPSLGFFYTYWKLPEGFQKIYLLAGISNLLVGLAIGFSPAMKIYAFDIAAVIQGLPALIDWTWRKLT
jgi:hypothetical protein